MEKCSSIGGHRFEARYDQKPTNEVLGQLMDKSKTLKLSDSLAHELAVSKTYVRDVCVKCGATVERE